MIPFVALWLCSKEDKEESNIKSIRIFLFLSSSAWLLTIIAFFSLIDLDFLNSFYGVTTASQYMVALFKTSTEDRTKFEVFRRRASFTKSISEEIKVWVQANISRWRTEKEEWFDIQLIPNDMLPAYLLAAEGGEKRKRSTVSLKEVISIK